MSISNKEKNKIVKETQIFDFSQFIDVLEAIEGLNSIENIKKDIAIRKKYMKEELERMEKVE